MEFKERRRGNKNRLKSSIIDESKMFEISQGNLRVNPFYFYTPINEARGKYLISCSRFFYPHKFQLFQ